jgi:hypothetical protein
MVNKSTTWNGTLFQSLGEQNAILISPPRKKILLCVPYSSYVLNKILFSILDIMESAENQLTPLSL